MNPRTLIRDLAGAITSKERFARNGSGVLYGYRDGVYRPDREMLIRRRVKHLLLHYDCTEMWSRRLAGEIVEFIALDVPAVPERPSIELINVENGFLNVRTRQLFPHSPDLLSTIRIPVTFDPQAGCPEIGRFIVFPKDAVPLAWDPRRSSDAGPVCVESHLSARRERERQERIPRPRCPLRWTEERLPSELATPGGRPLLGGTAVWEAGEHLHGSDGRAFDKFRDVQGHHRM